MRIGIIRKNISPYGGAENYLFRLSKELKQLGFSLSLFTADNLNKEINLRNGRNLDKTFNDIIYVNSGKNKSHLDFADSLQKVKPKNHCDVVFSLERIWEFDIYRVGDGIHKSWLERISAQDNSLANLIRRKKRKHREILELEKAMFRNKTNSVFIANSKLVAQELKGFYQVADKNIKIVYNGFTINQFKPEYKTKIRQSIREKFNIREDDLCLIFVGTGWKRKGLNFLLKLLKKTKDHKIHLFVAGKKESAFKLANYNIHFLGKTSNVNDFYLASDVFVLPTIYDPFSNATLEATCYDLPVITTTSNGCSEILKHKENSYTFPAENMIESLCSAIKFCQANLNDMKANIKVMNSHIREKFSIKNNSINTAKIINDYVKKN